MVPHRSSQPPGGVGQANNYKQMIRSKLRLCFAAWGHVPSRFCWQRGAAVDFQKQRFRQPPPLFTNFMPGFQRISGSISHITKASASRSPSCCSQVLGAMESPIARSFSDNYPLTAPLLFVSSLIVGSTPPKTRSATTLAPSLVSTFCTS